MSQSAWRRNALSSTIKTFAIGQTSLARVVLALDAIVLLPLCMYLLFNLQSIPLTGQIGVIRYFPDSTLAKRPSTQAFIGFGICFTHPTSSSSSKCLSGSGTRGEGNKQYARRFKDMGGIGGR